MNIDKAKPAQLIQEIYKLSDSNGRLLKALKLLLQVQGDGVSNKEYSEAFDNAVAVINECEVKK